MSPSNSWKVRFITAFLYASLVMTGYALAEEDGSADEEDVSDEVLVPTEQGLSPTELVSESWLQRGTWQHQVAIDLPPAPNNHAPRVAVVADHRAVGGILGHGWVIQSFSTIKRKGPNGGAPRMDEDDTFWLGGQRLYRVDGVTGLPPVPGLDHHRVETYRLEHDDNRVFTFDSVLEEWVVARDGHRWYYGSQGGIPSPATEYQSERLSDGCDGGPVSYTSPTAWHISSWYDAFGNGVEYTYDMLCGCPSDDPLYDLFDGEAACSHVLATIEYDTTTVSFAYEERTDPQAFARGRTAPHGGTSARARRCRGRPRRLSGALLRL